MRQSNSPVRQNGRRNYSSGRSAHTQVPDYLEATIYDKENAVIMASVHYCDIDPLWWSLSVAILVIWYWSIILFWSLIVIMVNHWCKEIICKEIQSCQVGNLADVTTSEQQNKVNNVTRSAWLHNNQFAKVKSISISKIFAGGTNWFAKVKSKAFPGGTSPGSTNMWRPS